MEVGAGAFDLRQDALCRLGAVAGGNETIEILDVAFRVLGKKNTVMHQDWLSARRLRMRAKDSD